MLLAHALTPKRRRIARLLAEAGHEVREVADPDDALALCRSWAPDVALIHVECCGDLVCNIKSDPVAYGTAVVMIERPGLEPAYALEGMRKGIQDFLVEPLADGEVLTRVEAAARTKELREELVAQGVRLESLLREDTLTGLSNRRAVLTQLAGMVSAARRHGHPLSIAILDLDHFKRVNDTHGHKVGDDVLVAAAHAMGTHLRAEDQLGRLGGEEFLVLLPDTDATPRDTSPRSCAWRSPPRRLRCRSRSASAWPPGTAKRPRTCCTAPTRPSTRPKRPVATGFWLLLSTAAHDHDRRG